MKDLTTRQQEILTFIEHYEWRNGFWPSIRDIQEQFGFASATEVVDIPVMGDIAAGYPDRVEPAGEIGRLQVDIQSAGFSSRRRSFALQVRGESMVDAEIYDGDMVIIEPRDAYDGDIVAALIDGETTLKRYIQKGGEPPYLKAENKFYPELYPVTELCVQGVAKAVVRSL